MAEKRGEIERVPPDEVGLRGGIATQLVAQGVTIVKAENETMSTIAVMRPRDERAIMAGAIQELEIAPEQAKAAYYSIPFKDAKSGRTLYVQGLSIDGATSLARRWGNCAVGGRIINEDETGIDVEGVFVDWQTNFRVAKPHRASKLRKVHGTWVEADEQRLLMAVQASVSKAQRNAIEAGLPPTLTGAYFEKARILTGGLPNEPADQKRVEAVVKAFERFKVTPAMLEESVGRPPKEWYGEDVANLRGLFKALMDGGITVQEIWPEKGAATATQTNGTVSVDSLRATGVKVEQTPQAPSAQPTAQPSPAPEDSAAQKAASLFE